MSDQKLDLNLINKLTKMPSVSIDEYMVVNLRKLKAREIQLNTPMKESIIWLFKKELSSNSVIFFSQKTVSNFIIASESNKIIMREDLLLFKCSLQLINRALRCKFIIRSKPLVILNYFFIFSYFLAGKKLWIIWWCILYLLFSTQVRIRRH